MNVQKVMNQTVQIYNDLLSSHPKLPAKIQIIVNNYLFNVDQINLLIQSKFQIDAVFSLMSIAEASYSGTEIEYQKAIEIVKTTSFQNKLQKIDSLRKKILGVHKELLAIEHLRENLSQHLNLKDQNLKNTVISHIVDRWLKIPDHNNRNRLLTPLFSFCSELTAEKSKQSFSIFFHLIGMIDLITDVVLNFGIIRHCDPRNPTPFPYIWSNPSPEEANEEAQVSLWGYVSHLVLNKDIFYSCSEQLELMFDLLHRNKCWFIIFNLYIQGIFPISAFKDIKKINLYIKQLEFVEQWGYYRDEYIKDLLIFSKQYGREDFIKILYDNNFIPKNNFGLKLNINESKENKENIPKSSACPISDENSLKPRSTSSALAEANINLSESFYFVTAHGIIPLKKIREKWNVVIVCAGSRWGFPKGCPIAEDKGDPIKTASRELAEETSLKIVRFIKLKPFVTNYTFENDGNYCFKTAIYYAAEVTGTIVLQEDELEGYQLVPIEKVHHYVQYYGIEHHCQKIFQRLQTTNPRQTIELESKANSLPSKTPTAKTQIVVSNESDSKNESFPNAVIVNEVPQNIATPMLDSRSVNSKNINFSSNPAFLLSPTPVSSLSPTPVSSLSPTPVSSLSPNPVSSLSPNPVSSLSPNPVTSLSLNLVSSSSSLSSVTQLNNSVAKKIYSYGIIPVQKVERKWHAIALYNRHKVWSFPKTRNSKTNLQPQERVKKELSVQCGLIVKRFLPLKMFNHTYEYTHGEEIFENTVAYFVAEVEGKIKYQENEIFKHCCKPLEKVQNLIIDRRVKEICQEVNSLLGQIP